MAKKDDERVSDNEKFVMTAAMVFRIVQLVLWIGGAVCFARFGFLPIVREIAGKDTNFNFDLVVNVSLVANVAFGGALVLSERDRRKAKRKLREKDSK